MDRSELIFFNKKDDFDWLQEEYIKSTFAAEKVRVLGAMASATQPHLQIKTLDFAISGHVRKQDMMGLISQVASLSPLGHLYTWNWLRSNWVALITIWKHNDFTRFNDMLRVVVSRFTQQVLVEEAEFLFLHRKDPDFFVPPRSHISIAKGLESAKQRIAWVEQHQGDVESWLISQGH